MAQHLKKSMVVLMVMAMVVMSAFVVMGDPNPELVKLPAQLPANVSGAVDTDIVSATAPAGDDEPPVNGCVNVKVVGGVIICGSLATASVSDPSNDGN